MRPIRIQSLVQGPSQTRSRIIPPTEHYMKRSLLGFLYILTYPVPSSLPLGSPYTVPVSYVQETYGWVTGTGSGQDSAETTGCVERGSI